MVKNPFLVFFGLFLVSMLFIPASIPATEAQNLPYFGASIVLNKIYYSWTDVLFIEVVAPNFNSNSGNIDYIGNTLDSRITITSTNGSQLDFYKLEEAATDNGVFVGAILLSGSSHAGTPGATGITSGEGPWGGTLEAKDGDTITVKFSETYSGSTNTYAATAMVAWEFAYIEWQSSSVNPGEGVIVTVEDRDMNLSPFTRDSLSVDVYSDSDSSGAQLVLTEKEIFFADGTPSYFFDSGIFEGQIIFTDCSSIDQQNDICTPHPFANVLAKPGDTITVEYTDYTLPGPDYTSSDSLLFAATAVTSCAYSHGSPKAGSGSYGTYYVEGVFGANPSHICLPADYVPITVTPPADITVTATDPAGAVVTWDPPTITEGTLPLQVFSPDDGTEFTGESVCAKDHPTQVMPQIEASGTLFPVGTTTVICKAWDIANRWNTNGEFTVTVNYEAPADTTPPTITFPSAIANGVVLPYPAPNFVDGHIFTWLVVGTIVSDNVAIDTSLGLPIINSQYASAAGLNCDKEHLWNINHSSWQEFPIGDTTITCTATDTSGNTATASFTVTLNYEAPVDTTPPVISFVAITTDVGKDMASADPNHTDVLMDGQVKNYYLPASGLPIIFSVGITDNITVYETNDHTGEDWPVCTVTKPNWSDYLGNAYSSGHWLEDIPEYFEMRYFFNSPHTFLIECTASDAAGNTDTASFTVNTTLPAPADTTSNFNTVLSYVQNSCIGFENAPAGTETVELLLNGSTYIHSGVADVNHMPWAHWPTEYIELYGVYPGQCLNEGFGSSTNGHSAGEYKVAAYDSSGNLISYSTPLVLEQWTNRGPSLTVPDDMTQTTIDPAGATVSFTATLTSEGPALETSGTNLFCNLSGQSFDESFTISHPVHTSTLQTLEVSGVFPVGTTTVSCNGYSVGGINANRQGDEFPTFDVTIVLADAAEPEIVIPDWIKNNAGWWASEQITDSDFVLGLQWLITEGTMSIPPTEQGAASDNVIPSWIKNNAEWWADGLIDNFAFVTGLQWLITNGIMVIG